ncbi:adenylate/guanylate cyclase domain-containing protein [Futiania mangrovi]|uniref:Adenylate/guanylate cyclase domain-containing protein n=1 Tax=Futiania mangrovi TaxID=2959716 RepID=A0A9J6PFZ3_9PROT|nr:adenylate/guanylate cyclase domain-containing protein [Futiania mangrovii]MCP1335535.1 adenylate/guanylate cyclase domain-containing protein [Futiania mangrovii]
MPRRLTTILAADVVGYSRLVRVDEEGTLAVLRSLRDEIVGPAIAARGGRIFKLMGDGILAEFPSVVEAVCAASEVQDALTEHQKGVDEARRIRLRIGVNLGDVVVDGDDLQGDGVNIAARLEGIAEAGGICVSASVHDLVGGRVPLHFEDLGEQALKNIERPLRVWKAVSVSAAPDRQGATSPGPRQGPSIAVVPFANVSGDPEQDYFADGVVDEIITSLGRMRWLTVIARSSTFIYKGRSPSVQEVSRDLSVRYVVEGSVRKAGPQVRIIAQLVEAESGAQLWAERFTGALDDIFDLQDRITAGVVAAIEPSVRQAEIQRAKRKRQDNLDAYDLYLRALDYSFRFSPDARAEALRLLDEAIKLDPGYAEAHGVAAFCRQQRYLWGGRDTADREAALRHADAVARAQTEDATSLAFAAMALSALNGLHDKALAMLERAVELNPNSAVAFIVRAVVEAILGRREESAAHAVRALRLSPYDPMRHIAEGALAVAKLAAGEPNAGLVHARRAVDANPIFTPALTALALCLVEVGRVEEAREAIGNIMEIAPDTCIGNLQERFLLANAIGFERVAAAMRAAGMPQ